MFNIVRKVIGINTVVTSREAILKVCRELVSAEGLEALGSFTGTDDESTACVTRMKMIRSTSMMSTSGVMLIAVIGRRGAPASPAT